MDEVEEASDEKDKQIRAEGFCQTLESETGWVNLEGFAAAPPMCPDNIHHYMYFVMKCLWRNDVTASKPFKKGYQIYHTQKVQNVAIHRVIQTPTT